MPLVWSVTSLVYHPLVPSAPAITARVAVGLVLSILTVTELEAESPALFIAEHVRVVPVVSVVRFEMLHPVEEAMPDSASVTDQLTVTLLIYQPLAPAVPVMEGVITGGVVSKIDEVL